MIGVTASSEVVAAAPSGPPAYVASSLTSFTATTGTKAALLPAGAAAGQLLTFHTAGVIPACAMDGTGWTVFTGGNGTFAYRTLTSGDVAAGQVTWTLGQNFNNAYALLNTFSGVGSVEQTSVVTSSCNADVYSPASGTVVTNGLLVALMGNAPPAGVAQGTPAAPWTSQHFTRADYQEIAMATRPADTADVTCLWPLTQWINSNPYVAAATILRLLP